jgi:hypothetical protein
MLRMMRKSFSTEKFRTARARKQGVSTTCKVVKDGEKWGELAHVCVWNYCL